MSESKFKVGDRVMCTDDGKLGVVTLVDIDEGKYVCNGYEVRFDDGYEEWLMADMLELSDEPPYDPKTAFLTELQALLRKYDAVINVVWDDDGSQTPTIDLEIQFCGDTRAIVFEDALEYTITADNIMDYEKE